MVQPDFYQSDGHASCIDLIRLDATSVIPPHAAPFLLGTCARVLRPKPGNHLPDGFEAQTTKPSASSVLHTRPPPLDACHLHPRPPGHQVFQSLRSTCASTILTRSTRSLPCTLRFSMSPDVSHRGWLPGLLVPRSKLHICPSPLPVHRHNTDLA